MVRVGWCESLSNAFTDEGTICPRDNGHIQATGRDARGRNYIHPEIIDTYMEGALLLEIKDMVEAELRDDLAVLNPAEVAVLTLLRARLGFTLEDKLAASLAA